MSARLGSRAARIWAERGERIAPHLLKALVTLIRREVPKQQYRVMPIPMIEEYSAYILQKREEKWKNLRWTVLTLFCLKDSKEYRMLKS